MTAKKQPLVKVQFRREHTHAGHRYKPGDPAEVTVRAKEKLLTFDAIKSDAESVGWAAPTATQDRATKS